MPQQKTFEKIALELSRALSPLQTLAGGLDEFANFLLTELGWEINDIPQPVKSLATDMGKLVTLTKDISDTDEIDPGKLAEIAATLIKLIDDIGRIAQASDAGLLPSLIAEQFLQKLPDELLQYLLVEYLRQFHPLGHAALQLLGITALEHVVTITPARPPHVRRKVYWSHFIDILTKPQEVFKKVYGWGTQDFNFLLLADNLADFSNALGLSTYLVKLDNNVAKVLEEKSDPETNLIKYYLKVPFAVSDTDAIDADFGISLFPLPQNNALKPGFAVMPYGNANVESRIKITDKLFFVFQTGFTVAGGIGIVARPEQEIKIFTGFAGGGGGGTVTGSFKAGLLFTGSDNAAIRLLTITEGIYLEIKSVSIYLGAALLSGDQKDFFAEFEIKGGKLVISSDGTDGFLSTILPQGGISANFDLVFGISALRGAYFTGSGGLEIQLPTHIQLGPIEIQSLTISAMPKAGAIPLNAGASIKATLGPLQVVVEDLGLTAKLSFPQSGGNLGLLDLALGFKPPKGVGLSVDAGVVKGGGYLYFDFDKEEYAGALELVFSNFINLKAIGLITTRMPDGSKGVSLLIIITVEFGTGIQLGFGFTLLAVGGLLGLNRTMRLQPMMEGVRSGTINNLMFPQNVIANITRIISDLRTIFPPEEGKFLIGPMAKIGWGSPPLISISLGIIIEIPGNLAIIGVLRVALPTADKALIVLQVSFAGAIEFDKKRFFFFASLFESRVLFMTLEGEMGVLAAFGDDADFVVTVGGFHPQYKPPPLPFPTPQRIALNILNEDNARIRVTAYFAVTSNAAMFGAHAELFFGFSDFGLAGHIRFDALFQFSPFYFTIQVSASVSLKAFGIGLLSIHLRLSLEGPTPWRAKGRGSISILFFEVSADFDITWGESRNTTLPPIEVMPLLKAEFEKSDNWRALLPTGNNLLVSLRKLDAAKDILVLHPLGLLRITQKAVPLDLTIDQVGNQKPSDAKRFVLRVSSSGLAKKADAFESFAPAQFQDMNDTSKLSRPPYGPEHSGLDLSMQGEQLASSKVVKRVVRYEQIILDTNFKRFAQRFFAFAGSLFTHFLAGNAVSRSSLSKHYRQQLQPFDEKVKVGPDHFSVAFNHNNKAFGAAGANFVSEARARDFMQQQVALNPELTGTLHVIPFHEVNKAA